MDIVCTYQHCRGDPGTKVLSLVPTVVSSTYSYSTVSSMKKSGE